MSHLIVTLRIVDFCFQKYLMFDLVFKLSFPADLQGDLPRGLAAAVGRREELVRHPADAEGHSLLRVARVAENLRR